MLDDRGGVMCRPSLIAPFDHASAPVSLSARDGHRWLRGRFPVPTGEMFRRYDANLYPGKGVQGSCIIVDGKGMLSEQAVVLCVPYYQNLTDVFHSRADKRCYRGLMV